MYRLLFCLVFATSAVDLLFGSVVLKAVDSNVSLPLLRDAPATTENSKEPQPSVKVVRGRREELDNYTSGLTPQLRTLLMAPESGEEQAHRHRKQSKEPQNDKNLSESEDSEDTYKYRNDYSALPQSHVEQLLRYYGKIAGKLLPQGHTKYRKLNTDHEKENVEKTDETDAKSLVENWTSEQQPKTQSTDITTAAIAANAAANAVVNANLIRSPQSTLLFPGYGTVNYLTAGLFNPPNPVSAYTAALRNRLLGAPSIGGYGPTQSNPYSMNCCSMCPCNSNLYDNGCANAANSNNVPATNNEITNGGSTSQSNGCGYGYSNAEETESDGYGPDNYFPGGYGRGLSSHEAATALHSHLLNSYPSNPQTTSSSSLYGSSKQQPNSFYQVSSGINSPYLLDAFSPTGSLYATSHMHHYGTHPTVMPYQQLLNTLAQRFNNGGHENDLGPFGPMFDNAAEPITITLTSPEPPTTTMTSEMHDEPISSVFHIVKPNFASFKKSNLSKKMKATKSAPLTTRSTTQPSITTRLPSSSTSSVKFSSRPSTTTKATTKVTTAKAQTVKSTLTSTVTPNKSTSSTLNPQIKTLRVTRSRSARYTQN